jgi:RNA polymerase sigma-70 factor (family 1)
MNEQLNFKEHSFEYLFKQHYPFLCIVSNNLVKDRDASKDIVQDFFVSYWQKRNSVSIETSFQAYAVKSVKNLSLQFIKKSEKEKLTVNNLAKQDYDFQISTDKPSESSKIMEILNKLPLKRREIFIAAILNGHTYTEIADYRNISVNTVKTQIKRSYLFLRSFPKEDLVITVVFILTV